MNALKRRLFSSLWLLVILTGCQQASPPPDPVALQLKWYHQAQFAGFYWAKDKGLYRQAGLTTTLVEGGPQQNPIDAVVEGHAQFAVSSPEEVIRAVYEGKPVVAIAAIYQRNPMVFMARPDSEIHSPRDFAGKRISFPGDQGRLLIETVAAKVGLDIDSIKIQPYTKTHAPLQRGEVDVVTGYVINWYLQAKQQGFEPRIIWPDDFGVHFYGDVLITSRQLLKTQPELAQRFVTASVEGWQQALNQPEASLEQIMNYAPASDRTLQAAMLEQSIPLVLTSDRPVGTLDPDIWADTEAAIKKIDKMGSKAVAPPPSYSLQALTPSKRISP